MSTATATTRGYGRDYGYSNARVRGMRSRLLTPAFLEQLMAAPELARQIQLLMDTPYGEDLEAAVIHGRTPATVDEALRANMIRTFQKVIGFINDEAYQLVTTVLGRWDLFNVKSIVRGKHMAVPPDEIEEGLYALGALNPVDLHLLANLPDVHAVVDTLWTWDSPYAVPLRANLSEYLKTNDLAVLELALDRHYTGWAAERLSGRGDNVAVVRRILGLQTDSVNLLTAFRLLKSDIGDTEPVRYFLPGGLFVKEDLFLRLTALSDVDEVLDALQRTPFGSHLEDVIVRYVEENSLSVFERALEDYVMRRALAAGQGDPLGIGIIVSYLFAKQNEVTNLRIIVKGTSVGMPADRMRKELILV